MSFLTFSFGALQPLLQEDKEINILLKDLLSDIRQAFGLCIVSLAAVFLAYYAVLFLASRKKQGQNWG